MTIHPGTDAKFGVTVAGRDVDVIDPELQQHFQRAVRVILADLSKSGCTEDCPRAVVTRPTERLAGNHNPTPCTCLSLPYALGARV